MLALACTPVKMIGLRHIISGICGALLFAALGPPAITLPGLPHILIKDAQEHQFTAPSRNLTGPLEPNTLLQGATVLFNNTIKSSETVEVLPDGSLLLMDKYGYVFKAVQDSNAPGGYALQNKPIVQLGPGRPLGFKPDADGNIIICNAGHGLQKLVLPDGHGSRARVELLGAMVSPTSEEDPNTPILYANALDIASDGTVYFTDSQAIPVRPNWGIKGQAPWYDTFWSWRLGMYAAHQAGRLLAYYPHNGTIHVLAKGFFYSNGVALSEDESYLVMAETNKFRLVRYWLKGKKAGTMDLLIERLPGFPDGVSRALNGKGFWVALPAPRTKIFDVVLKWRVLRVIAAWLPQSMQPKVPRWGATLLVSPSGDILRFLLDPTGQHVQLISDVTEHSLPQGGSRLWMASVSMPFIAYYDLQGHDSTAAQ